MSTPARNPKSTVPVRRDRSVIALEPPVEVREVADALIGALGENLAALLWHGSWVRGEQRPGSDHDMIVVVKSIDEKVLKSMQEVFKGRNLWSTYVKTEEELRQYPMTGRLQFHHGNVVLYGRIEPPPVTREGLIEELRRTAVDVQHECRYRLIHGSGGGIYAGMDPAYPRMREARWMYYQVKLTVLALKTREVLRGRSYPANRKELSERLTGEDELAIVDVIDRWPQLRAGFEEDIKPIAIQLDRVMRNIVTELDHGLAE